ncbi:antigen 5 like allergen Cul n 1-like [Topomyia yanbarensis]|uniref:antigen 5 like allergen Cul n 1-like n=1 Tax=Topomyia yanbarensis TaxID=2498891 RepID=UPI00273B20A2|nr:antigen 5 like allergen Cul n 1-like [Topomyia yanbarensis]
MIRVAKSWILLAMFLAALRTAYTVNYCDRSLCPASKPHIACKDDGKLSSECPPGAKIIEMNAEMKELILDTHNKYRSTLATGGVGWLPKAAAMPTLTWDDDLAETAQVNANRCVRGHDVCHNTDKYKNSGQNLNFFATSADTIDVKDQVPKLIGSWWDERHDVHKNMVKTMYDPGKGTMVFHFAVLAGDKVNKIGCAITQWKPPGGWIQIYLVCNYSFNDFVGLPIYVSGEPCSKCQKGCNPKYAGLCNEDEPVPQLLDYPAGS